MIRGIAGAFLVGALVLTPAFASGCSQARSAVQTYDTGYIITERATAGGVTINVDPSWNYVDVENGFYMFDVDEEEYITISIATSTHGQVADPAQGFRDLWGFTAQKVSPEVVDEWEEDGITCSIAETYDEEEGFYRQLYGYDPTTEHGFLLNIGFPPDSENWPEERIDAVFDWVINGVVYDPSQTTIDYAASVFGNTSSTYEGETVSQHGFFASTTLAGLGDFESTTVSGSGDDVIEVPAAGKSHLMSISHTGGGNFAVKTVDVDGEMIDLLVNTIGNYSGVVTDYPDFQDVRMLSISADGDWTVTFSPMKDMQPLANGGQNTGDNVLYIDEESLTKLGISNTGESNFSVWAVGMEDYDLLVNEIGAYDGTVLWNEPQSFLIVNSESTWTVS